MNNRHLHSMMKTNCPDPEVYLFIGNNLHLIRRLSEEDYADACRYRREFQQAVWSSGWVAAPWRWQDRVLERWGLDEEERFVHWLLTSPERHRKDEYLSIDLSREALFRDYRTRYGKSLATFKRLVHYIDTGTKKRKRRGHS